MKRLISALLAAGFILACGVTTQTPPPPVVVDLMPAPTYTPEPTLAPTQTYVPTASPAAFVPFHVTTWADNVVLRTNPGYLFDKLGILKKYASLLVVGRSEGAEWLLVQTEDHRSGWVFTKLVETMGRPLGPVPVVTPADVLLVKGRVTDDSGKLISGVQFALVQGTGDNAPRNDAMTDETGVFFAFMPQQSSGTWWMSYVAIACTSNIMDASCNFSGEPDPKGVNIQLPRDAGPIWEFKWRY